MLRDGKDTDGRVNNLTDQNIILLVSEFAKVDDFALMLMVQLQMTEDFGQQDMIISKMNRFLKDKHDL